MQIASALNGNQWLCERSCAPGDDGSNNHGGTRYDGLQGRVDALWLASKLLKTKDAVRLALAGLGTVGRLLG
jgi:hypothetical protein